MKTIVVSFGSEGWGGSLEALRHSALRHGADEFWAYGPDDVGAVFEGRPHLDPRARGHGHWAWKPWVIRDALGKAEVGDVVVWCDAGMVIESSLRELAVHVAGTILPRLGGWSQKDLSNRAWTRRDVLERLDPSGSTWDAPQVNAAFQAYRASDAAKAFADEYLRRCLEPGVLDDLGDPAHRHDQSVLSALAELSHKSRNGVVEFCRDVTQYGADDPPHPDSTFDFGRLVHHHRRKLDIPRVAVVTPTVGGPHLAECVRSVQSSALAGLEHWIVIDGPEHEPAAKDVIRGIVGDGGPRATRVPVVTMTLPRNVGAGGWNGHRTFGAAPWFVDADYVAFLDDDNLVSPEHYRDLLAACLAADAPWGHSLRRIIDRDGAAVCDDNCESLGGISHTVSGPGHYLVDTSCYLIQRDLALRASPAWNARFRDPERPEPDRELCRALLSGAPHAVSRKHSVAYRVGSTARSVGADFFLRGNAVRRHDFARFGDAYVFHFSRDATDKFLKLLVDDGGDGGDGGGASHALDEWQMTLWRGLSHTHGGDLNLIDGFSNCPNLPLGATCLIALCNPADLPLDFFASRKDLKKIVYTLESPNVRHAAQWDFGFLETHFDVALTYYGPLLRHEGMRTVFAPHNTHHGDLDDPADRKALLRDNRDAGRSAVMVLERRPALYGKDYSVNGATMRSLDHLREALVDGLDDVTVHGLGWDDFARGRPGIKLGGSVHRSRDPRHAVDIIQDHAFAVIVENCEAEGYASEKLYDALSAGAIPLYYGWVPDPIRELLPEGPERGAYVDLRERGIVTGAALRDFLRGIDDDTLAAMKRRVLDVREGVLRAVGVRAFADAARAAIAAAAEI